MKLLHEQYSSTLVSSYTLDLHSRTWTYTKNFGGLHNSYLLEIRSWILSLKIEIEATEKKFVEAQPIECKIKIYIQPYAHKNRHDIQWIGH